MLRKFAYLLTVAVALSCVAQARAQEFGLGRRQISQRDTEKYLERLKQVFETHGPALKRAVDQNDFEAVAVGCREVASKIAALPADGVHPAITRCSLKTAMLLNRAARIYDELADLTDPWKAFLEGLIPALVDVATETFFFTPIALANRVNRLRELEQDYRQLQRDAEKLQEEWLHALEEAAKYFDGSSRPAGNSRSPRLFKLD